MSEDSTTENKQTETERPEKERLDEKPKKDRVALDAAPELERPGHWGPRPGTGHYYDELARVVTTMFVGVLALMTFLLTVGLQRPHGMFRSALYTAVIILPLNLLAYVFGHLFAEQAKEAKIGGEAKFRSANKRLRVVRFIQQLLFVLAVLAVAWFAFSAAQFFFNLPANPAAGAGAAQ